MLGVKPIHTRISSAGSQRSPREEEVEGLGFRASERVRSKGRSKEQSGKEDDIKRDVKNLSARFFAPSLTRSLSTSLLQAPNTRGAERDDGMTNGIWHAMHTADKGEGNRATVCPSSIWGNLPRTQDVCRVGLFFESTVAIPPVSAFPRTICNSNTARAPCGNASAKDGMKRERKWEERAVGRTDGRTMTLTRTHGDAGNRLGRGIHISLVFRPRPKKVWETLSPRLLCFQLETID